MGWGRVERGGLCIKTVVLKEVGIGNINPKLHHNYITISPFIFSIILKKYCCKCNLIFS